MTSPYGAPHDTDTGTLPWMLHAVCTGVDPDLFFPERGGDSNPAKAVCRTCPVRPTCLEYALANGERFGVWGGMSERERRQERRRRALIAGTRTYRTAS